MSPISDGMAAAITNSKLLRLPGELRNLIYTFHFSSIYIHRGPKPKRTKLLPKHTKNPLSLLLVCHQTHTEAKGLWLQNVEFSFLEPILLTTKLRYFPAPARVQIRHVRIRPKFESPYDWLETYENMLAYNLPDLKPETFTVVGMGSWKGCRKTLDRLLADRVQWGRGLQGLEWFLRDPGKFWFEVSWKPGQVSLKTLSVFPGWLNIRGWECDGRDYAAMRVSVSVYCGKRRVAVFVPGDEAAEGLDERVNRLKMEGELRKKERSFGFVLLKKFSNKIWNRVKPH